MKQIFFLIVACICSDPFAVAADKPNVLIVGDSISLGYTPHVIELMKDEANVVHHKGNAQHTGTGLQKLEAWLGDTEWDVIHFNWGMWDLCYRHPKSKVQGRRDKVRGTLTTPLEQYEQNLDQLVTRLRKIDSALIWANTTVVPEAEAGRKVDDDLKYNEAAARVMKKHHVVINDLNQLTRTFSADLFTRRGDVHFTPAGYQKLAEQVTNSIRSALSPKEKTVSRVFFGSCIKQDRPMPILGTMAEQKPDLMIYLGDNIYGDTEDMGVLQAKYDKLAANADFQRLRDSCPTLATWDDHDYGVNDGGADYAKRKESEQIFEDFWFGQTNTEARSHPGIYDAHVFGPAGKQVQVILLDTRYFRSPLKRGEKRVGGSWLPDADPAKMMLGDQQWKWLKVQLQQPAQVRIIASSIQFLAEDAGQETWSNLPRERQRMLDLIKATNANGVLFISGDRHWSELSRLEDALSYPLFDFTSSSFNQLHKRGTPTKNGFRALPKTYHQENYGVISIAWDQPHPTLLLEIRDIHGDVQMQHTANLAPTTK